MALYGQLRANRAAIQGTVITLKTITVGEIIFFPELTGDFYITLLISMKTVIRMSGWVPGAAD